MSCEYKEKVLQLLKNELDDKKIEDHIEHCPECSALVEGYLEKSKELAPDIPQTEYDGPDQKLTEGIVKYNRGRGRIIAFTVIGLIMGWLSFRYTQDTFIVTKVIMAIPYKINEAIYTTLHSVPIIYRTGRAGTLNEFFPQSFLITFMAERITPVLIGGAIYGSFGYFTGSKRIFTLSKYLKFAFTWCCIILLWIGIVFAGNSVSIKKNANLEDIRGFFISAKNHGSGFYKNEERSEVFETLEKALGDVNLLKNIKDYKVTDSQTEVDIYLGFGRMNVTVVNWDENYMIMDMGRVVRIPEAFSKLIKDYYYSTGIFSDNSNVGVSEVTTDKEVNTNEAAD